MLDIFSSPMLISKSLATKQNWVITRKIEKYQEVNDQFLAIKNTEWLVRLYFDIKIQDCEWHIATRWTYKIILLVWNLDAKGANGGTSRLNLVPLTWSCNDAIPLPGDEVQAEWGVDWPINMSLQWHYLIFRTEVSGRLNRQMFHRDELAMMLTGSQADWRDDHSITMNDVVQLSGADVRQTYVPSP